MAENEIHPDGGLLLPDDPAGELIEALKQQQKNATVPEFANGGIVTGPPLFIAGECGPHHHNYVPKADGRCIPVPLSNAEAKSLKKVKINVALVPAAEFKKLLERPEARDAISEAVMRSRKIRAVPYREGIYSEDQIPAEEDEVQRPANCGSCSQEFASVRVGVCLPGLVRCFDCAPFPNMPRRIRQGAGNKLEREVSRMQRFMRGWTARQRHPARSRRGWDARFSILQHD